VATYAHKTSVAPEKTRGEIEKTLMRYGADSFAYASTPTGGVVAFVMHGRKVRIELKIPDIDDREFTHAARNKRSPAQVKVFHDQAIRQRWRALLLVTKALLESVEAEIQTFDEAFMSHLVLPNGATIGQQMNNGTFPTQLDNAMTGGTLELMP
jgi:hypothetical protein